MPAVDRDEHKRHLAALAAADRTKRAAAEPLIAAKEAALARAQAKLSRLKGDLERLEGELDEARRDLAASDEEAPDQA